ncbi:hypothetical protein Unana1_04649 [Umbelopsis nana]
MKRNKILVIGRPNAYKLDIVKQLLTESQCKVPEDLNDSSQMIPWTIDTKYYTASVDIWLDHIESDAEEAVKAFVDDKNGICEVVDCLVLVFRKDEPESFDDLKLWTAFVEKCDPSVKIVVGTSSELPPKNMDDVENWCTNNMFVYVDADEKQQIKSEDEFGDKVGIPLLLETLEANLWDGLVLKSSSQAPSEIDTARLQMLDLGLEDEDGDFTDLPSEKDIRKMQQELFGAFDDPNDGLDQAFAKIQNLRELGANLPDNERRKLAAEVALSFAAHFNEKDESI